VLGGGGGGAAWNGTIQVCPGDLEAAAPGFSAASGQVLEAMAALMPWADPGGAGISDAGAGAAWARLVQVWTTDLNTLSNELDGMGANLAAAGSGYQAIDDNAMSCRVVGG
jgi:hypothetical protein